MAGTTETLTLELARALEPLRERLATTEGAVALFAEMGLPLPPPVQTAIESAPQLPGIVTSIGTVGNRLPALLAAIASGNAGQIATAVGGVATPALSAFNGVRDLGDRVRSAFGDPSSLDAEIRNLVAALPARLLGWIVVSHLEQRRPALLRLLAVPGVMESTRVPAAGTEPAMTRRILHFDRVGALLSDPEQLLTDVYGWGRPSAPADATLLLSRLGDLLAALQLFAVFEPAVPELRAMLLSLRPATGGPPTQLDLSLFLSTLTGLDLLLSPAGSPLEVRLRGQGALDVGTGLRISPPATISPISPAATVDGEVTLSVQRSAPAGQPILLFGQVGGTRLQADALRASAGARFAAGTTGVSADLAVEAEVRGGRIVVAFAGADGFLTSVLPSTAELAFDLGVRWTEEEGLTFRGGAELAVTIPMALDIGPVRLQRLDLAVRARPGAVASIAVEARIAGGVTLGPFSASVDGLGAGADVLLRGGSPGGTPPPAAIDLGVVAIAFRFLPPSGLGLGVNAGPISGGGFIRYEEASGRYSGTFELKLGTVGVQAIGLLDTRIPGSPQSYALLVVIRASFPPIQIGFGFALSSVGGLLALNRRIDVDALRARMASGTAGRILAPEDPVRNAPVLLSDLSAVFPVAPGVNVVGPTLQLSWAELVRFDIGVFIELPGPTRIVLLGSARAAIENPSGGRPYLQIRLDILGVLDFARQTLEFDAALVDSHLLEILELTGGAAFRLSWGPEPYMVLTVGGFHPAYSPAPLAFPASLTRIAMTRGAPTDFLYFRFEGYFAVTTNTLQFGASVEVVINVGDFNIRGFLGFDALIRFSPFHFQFGVRASVRVRWRSHTLAGLSLRGELSGPGPVVFHGQVCIEILFFEICFEETFTLGSSSPPQVTPVASAVAELVTELEDAANVSQSEASDRFVTVAPATGVPLPVVLSTGPVVWSQERAPLRLLLQRFEGAPLSRPETVTPSGPQVSGPELDWFAPGSFAQLSDADALNRRAFERLQAGVRLGVAGVDDGPSATLRVTVKQIRLPAPATFPLAVAMPPWVLRATAGRTGAIERDPVSPALGIRDERWAVRGGDGSTRIAGISQAQAHQLATVGSAGTAVAELDTVPSFAI